MPKEGLSLWRDLNPRLWFTSLTFLSHKTRAKPLSYRGKHLHFLSGYSDSNREGLLGRQKCCQLHHSQLIICCSIYKNILVFKNYFFKSFKTTHELAIFLAAFQPPAVGSNLANGEMKSGLSEK